MATIETAIQIAAKAHQGVTDKQGMPYILHPLRVMHAVRQHGLDCMIVAVLHDVVEDTSVTIASLREEGFSDAVLQAVQCVTHERGSYGDYVVRCKANPIALQVKLADLQDNSSLDRVLMRPRKVMSDTARMRKYALSYRFLTDQITEKEYRELIEGD